LLPNGRSFWPAFDAAVSAADVTAIVPAHSEPDKSADEPFI
jgi:hypothetical protein